MLHKIRWTERKIGQRIALIEPLVYRRKSFLPPFRFQRLPDPMSAPLIAADVDDSAWEVIAPGTYWGTWMTDFMLRTRFRLPADWDPAQPVAIYLPLGESGDFSHPETLAYIDGAPYAAADRHHQEILLPPQWKDGKEHLLALHGWTGLGGWRNNEPRTKLFMRECALVQLDMPTRDFVAAARVAQGIASNLDANSPAKGHLLNALDAAFNLLDIREPFGDEFYASVPAAHAALRAGVAKAGPPMDTTIVATGHSHIDVAWLWTLGQTRRKSGRTFHNVLRLMEQFPDYHFSQSQAQLYDYVRQDYPQLFADIKKRVADGRWEPMGGMWVEADCNISGPESLARQFLLGRSFWRQHFGKDVDSPVLWLPDVFGYAWNLPQLIKEAGCDYFFTIKIGWNQYNRLPYDSFWWQGLDGTRVLTHFSTTPDAGGYGASTYNASARPDQALGTWTNFQQKELQTVTLMSYGYGDGGGGPTREMIENIREMAAFPATPRMRQDSVAHFFREMERQAGDRLPTWNGELYFELHRGTYTTQSRNKRGNRKSEFLLHDVEFLATLAGQLDASYRYPADTLTKAWQLVCLNQFHDIIPGSSIGPVYVESQQQYGQIREMGAAVRDAAQAAIASKIGGDVIIANPTSSVRSDLAVLPGKVGALQRADGTPVLTQGIAEGTLIAAGDLPPMSVTPLRAAEKAAAAPVGLTVSPTHLENAHLRVELNAAGDITRIYDKDNSREALPAGTIANQLLAFEDRPMNWDAWDVDIFYDDKHWLANPATSIKVVEAGPLRATIEIERRVLNSPFTQRVSLTYNSPRLDFDTTINWTEKHILLKAAFPVDVLSPTATYEIQWGNVERPTHRNTSWDWARFETCAQKWVDLSEGDYGVSLLNDCKYGHDIQKNVMRISLLRGTTNPDPNADQGEHRFAYSLLPHAGRVSERTVAAAYALNDPLIAWQAPLTKGGKGGIPAQPSLVAADRANIVIETVKRAEDGNGVIIRLYDTQRQRGKVTLTCGFPVKAAWRANILEENQAALSVEGNRVTLHVKPFEIATIRVVAV
jgi:alpha-mannosidase